MPGTPDSNSLLFKIGTKLHRGTTESKLLKVDFSFKFLKVFEKLLKKKFGCSESLR